MNNKKGDYSAKEWDRGRPHTTSKKKRKEGFIVHRGMIKLDEDIDDTTKAPKAVAKSKSNQGGKSKSPKRDESPRHQPPVLSSTTEKKGDSAGVKKWNPSSTPKKKRTQREVIGTTRDRAMIELDDSIDEASNALAKSNIGGKSSKSPKRGKSPKRDKSPKKEKDDKVARKQAKVEKKEAKKEEKAMKKQSAQDAKDIKRLIAHVRQYSLAISHRYMDYWKLFESTVRYKWKWGGLDNLTDRRGDEEVIGHFLDDFDSKLDMLSGNNEELNDAMASNSKIADAVLDLRDIYRRLMQ